MEAYRKILAEIESINKISGAPDFVAPLKHLLDEQKPQINIAVVGQFKAGKSSLVNSIIKMNILPVSVVPVTAVITILQFGENPLLEIHLTDGRISYAELSELPLYVTEKHNPENVRHVEFVIVEHPVLQPFGTLRVVDTPGLGSFYKHNSDATTQWMPFTGVALVAISAEHPLSEEDLLLIKAISQYCPDVAVVITKIDLFDTQEVIDIKAYVSSSIQKSLGAYIPIFEFSTNSTTVDYAEHLFTQFIDAYKYNTDEHIQRIIHYKLRSITQQSILYCDLALQSALKHETEKEQVARTLHDLLNSRHYREREMLLTVTNFKSEIRDRLSSIFLPCHGALLQKITTLFQTDYYTWQGSLMSVTNCFEQWLKHVIGAQIDEENFSKVNQIVKEASDYLQYTGIQFKQQLDEKLYAVFKVHLPDAYWQIDFTGVEKPDISVYRVFDSHLDMLLFFLPMQKWTKKLFQAHFRNQISSEIEKNIERYISNLTEKIFKTINNIHAQSLQYMNEELKKVQHILSNTGNNSEQLQENLDRLKAILSEISQKSAC